MNKKLKAHQNKNRMWKSKCLHRLKGKPEEVVKDFFNGLMDLSVRFPRKALSRRGE